MAKNNNLTDFLTDIAETIRGIKGTSSTSKINPQKFSDEIKSMVGGNASAVHILSPMSAYVNGELVNGTMQMQELATPTVTVGPGPDTKSLSITATNNQSSSKYIYETDATVKSVTKTVTAGIRAGTNNKIVDVSCDDNSIGIEIPTTTRAGTTISGTADDTANTITITASNDQGTGWVTGSNQTASTTVKLTQKGATTTVTAAEATITNVIPSGSITLTGGGLIAGSGSVDATIPTGLSLCSASSTKPSSGDYITITGNGTVSRNSIFANAAEGYITSASGKSEGNKSATSNTATKYISITKSDGAAPGLSFADATASSSTTVMVTAKATNKLSSGYYAPSSAASREEPFLVEPSLSDTSATNAAVSATSSDITLTQASSKPTSGKYITVTGHAAARAKIDLKVQYPSSSSSTTVTPTQVHSIPTSSKTVYYTFPSTWANTSLLTTEAATASHIAIGRKAYVNGELITGTHIEEGVSSNFVTFAGFAGSSSLTAPAAMRFRYCKPNVFPTLDNYSEILLSSGFNISALSSSGYLYIQEKTLVTFDFEKSVSNYRIKSISLSGVDCSMTWVSPICFYVVPTGSNPLFYMSNVTWVSI